MPYIRERCVAGNTIEIRKYFSPRIGVKGEIRMKRVKPTPESVKKANIRKAERELRQLMNANFDKRSWSLTLTFSQAPSLEELQKEVARYTRRLRSIAKKKKTEVKYIYVFGIGKKAKHIHMIVSGLTAEELSEAWTAGHVNQTKIYSENLRDLANYFMKNAENSRKRLIEAGLKPGRRYNGSRNLKKPKVTHRVIKANTFRTEIREPKGYYLEKDSVYQGISGFTGLPVFEYTFLKLEGTEGCG